MKSPYISAVLSSILASSVFIFGISCGKTARASPNSSPYSWRNVTIGGGGAVTGISVRPGTNTYYVRTDVGGAYRWDAACQRWIALSDAFNESQSNWYGTESIAMDPGDAKGQTVYAAVGKYAADWAQPAYGDILKSVDGGKTWDPAGLKLNVASNWDQRFGERLAVDPHDSNVLVYASRGDGLWRSDAAGAAGSWKRVATAPSGPLINARNRNPSGLSFVVFDKTSAFSGGPSRILYVGAWDTGIYQSRDAGMSWELLPGGPTQPYRAAISETGVLYVTHATGVARFASGVWKDVSPEKGLKFQAIAVDPNDPNHVVTARIEWRGGNSIYRSVDGGESWTLARKRSQQKLSWQSSYNFAAAIESLAFDPMVPRAAFYTDWFNVWHTPDITVPVAEWTNLYAGHEELVTVGGLVSPPSGAPLHSGVADLDGFLHESLDAPPTRRMSTAGFPGNHTSTSIDFAENDNSFMVRVGRFFWDGPGSGGYSVDGGYSWTPFTNVPGAGGRVAVSAAGNRIVWLPQGQVPFYSDDRGSTWSASIGAPAGAMHGTTIFQYFNQPLAADRVDPNLFYLFKSGSLYRSVDGGITWSAASRLPDPGDWHTIQAAPGMKGEVWAGLDAHGIYRSSDSGDTFTRIRNVQRAHLMAFGQAAPGRSNPSVFIYGRVEGKDGIFRSDDMGATWVSIGNPKVAIGNEPNTMAGDRQVFGRVYIGTNGRGIYYGQLSKSRH